MTFTLPLVPRFIVVSMASIYMPCVLSRVLTFLSIVMVGMVGVGGVGRWMTDTGQATILSFFFNDTVFVVISLFLRFHLNSNLVFHGCKEENTHETVRVDVPILQLERLCPFDTLISCTSSNHAEYVLSKIVYVPTNSVVLGLLTVMANSISCPDS